MQCFPKKGLIFASGLQKNVPAEFSSVEIIDCVFVINIKLWLYLYIGILLTYQLYFCKFHENMPKNDFGNPSFKFTAQIYLTVFHINPSHFLGRLSLRNNEHIMFSLAVSLYVAVCSGALLKVCRILKMIHSSILACFFSELFLTARYLLWVWSITDNCHVINYCFHPSNIKAARYWPWAPLTLPQPQPFSKSAGYSWHKFSWATRFIPIRKSWDFQKRCVSHSTTGGLTTLQKGVQHRTVPTKEYYLLTLICSEVFLSKYFHLTFTLREPV